MLVPERDWLECEDRFTRSVHGLDLVFEAFRGNKRAEMPTPVDDDTHAVSDSHSTDAGDERVRMSAIAANANPARFVRSSEVADINIIAAGEISTGLVT